MSTPIWIGSPVDIRHDDLALNALTDNNDRKYWSDHDGIIAVDKQRWDQAQEFERETWMEYVPYAASDRNEEHRVIFDNYSNIPTQLGDLLEVGCGPFTQTKTILDGRIAKSITLLDPLINKYKSHQNCTYNTLIPKPELLSIRAEEHDVESRYDIIICINVLEHVMDVNRVLDNICKALKSNGILIFSERTYDNLDINVVYDVGHPIRIKNNTIERFLSKFSVMYYKVLQHQFGDIIYNIGRKI